MRPSESAARPMISVPIKMPSAHASAVKGPHAGWKSGRGPASLQKRSFSVTTRYPAYGRSSAMKQDAPAAAERGPVGDEERFGARIDAVDQPGAQVGVMAGDDAVGDRRRRRVAHGGDRRHRTGHPRPQARMLAKRRDRRKASAAVSLPRVVHIAFDRQRLLALFIDGERGIAVAQRA